MNLRKLLMTGFSAGIVLSAGCTPRSTRSDDDRFRGMIPTSRTREREKEKEKEKPIAVKPIDRPSEPLLLAPPMPDDRPTIPVDFQKPASPTQPTQPIIPVVADASTPPGLIGRLRDRREERNERRMPLDPVKPDPKTEPKTLDTPTLPSPFAKDKAPTPSAVGSDFTTPSETATPKPAMTSPSPDRLEAVKRVYSLAKQKWDGLKDYEAKLVRREVIGGKETPSEEMIFKFRKEPYSVSTKNIGGAGRGREVIYVAGPGAKMHILTGEGDNRLVGAGFYTQASPDDRMVTAKSRHKITEGAVGRTVEMLGKAIAKAEKGQFEGLRSLGQVKRPEYANAVEGIEAVLPPGADPELPKGGKREVYFDANPQSPSYGLPVLIRLLEGERELEYYAFSQFKVPANFTDADFDSSRFGKRK